MSIILKDPKNLGQILKHGTKLLLKLTMFRDPILMTYVGYRRGRYEFESRDSLAGKDMGPHQGFNSIEDIYEAMR